MIRYEIEDVHCEQRARGYTTRKTPWTLIFEVRVTGSESLGEILTDIEQRLADAVPTPEPM